MHPGWALSAAPGQRPRRVYRSASLTTGGLFDPFPQTSLGDSHGPSEVKARKGRVSREESADRSHAAVEATRSLLDLERESARKLWAFLRIAHSVRSPPTLDARKTRLFAAQSGQVRISQRVASGRFHPLHEMHINSTAARWDLAARSARFAYRSRWLFRQVPSGSNLDSPGEEGRFWGLLGSISMGAVSRYVLGSRLTC